MKQCSANSTISSPENKLVQNPKKHKAKVELYLQHICCPSQNKGWRMHCSCVDTVCAQQLTRASPSPTWRTLQVQVHTCGAEAPTGPRFTEMSAFILDFLRPHTLAWKQVLPQQSLGCRNPHLLLWLCLGKSGITQALWKLKKQANYLFTMQSRRQEVTAESNLALKWPSTWTPGFWLLKILMQHCTTYNDDWDISIHICRVFSLSFTRPFHILQVFFFASS